MVRVCLGSFFAILYVFELLRTTFEFVESHTARIPDIPGVVPPSAEEHPPVGVLGHRPAPLDGGVARLDVLVAGGASADNVQGVGLYKKQKILI